MGNLIPCCRPVNLDKFMAVIWNNVKVGNPKSLRLCAKNPHTLTFELLEKQIHTICTHSTRVVSTGENTNLSVKNETNSESNTAWTISHCVHCLSHQISNNFCYYIIIVNRSPSAGRSEHDLGG